MKEQDEYVKHIFEKLENNDLEGLTEDVRFYQMHTDPTDGREVAVYFDNSSVIDLLVGVDAVYKAGELFTDRFKAHSGLVHAMAYSGWLGTFNLLSKHQEEFISKFNSDDRLFPSQDSALGYKSRKDELIQRFSSRLPDLLLKGNALHGEMEKLKENALLIFYLVFLLREKGWWKNRFSRLKNKHKLLIYNKEGPVKRDTEIISGKLFRELFNELSRIRQNRSINNYQDAIALCQLEARLRYAVANSTEPLPVFYASNPRLIDVVKKVVSEKYAGQDVQPFHYRTPDGNYHRIVRDSDYFIIKGVSHQLEQMDRAEGLSEFKQSLLEFEQQIAAFPVLKRGELAQETYKLSLVNFLIGFMESWLSEKAAEELAEVYQDIPDSEEFQRELNEFIEQEKELLVKLNAKANQQNKIIVQLWRGLENVDKNLFGTKKEFSPIPLDVAELEARFGYGDKVNQGVEKIIREINDLAGEKFEDGNTPSLRKVGEAIRPVKADIISDILHAYELDESEDPSVETRKQERLELAIGALWMLERYSVIDAVCDIFRDKYKDGGNYVDFYPHYRVVLIHVAAILQKNDDLKKAERLIGEIETYYETIKEPRYKINIGLSYLYSVLWDKSLYPDSLLIPEQAIYENSDQIKGKPLEFLQKGEARALRALGDLEEHMDKPTLNKKRSHYLRKQVYLYNNIVFLRTYGASAEVFKNESTKLFKRRIYNSFRAPELSQLAKYHDTLARFYLRMAALEEWDSPEQNSWINQAKVENELAIKHSPKDKSIYNQLKQDVFRVRLEPWFRHCQPFQGEPLAR